MGNDFKHALLAVLIVAFCIISVVELVPLAELVDNSGTRVIRATPSSDPFKRWPNKTVHYQIDPELSSIKDDIESAFREVEAATCIRYIRTNPVIDYVTFVHNTTRCYEPVGRQGGSQSIFINIPDCGNHGFYLHASMQVLGFYHEHQRLDRDDYITIYPENINPDWLWAFEKLNATTHFRNSTYDIDSIMHYGSYQFSTNGKPTILTKSGGLIPNWEEKAKFSPLDVQAMNDYYDCRNSAKNLLERSTNVFLFVLTAIALTN